ncbi:hypothetical protein P12x_000096 [Tundrisphaera lichenicola]|uniref:hypothetical protein n=1 Tax=Tundrisphaera lichenicola TaxID=2029860 RepID=UPI003EBE217B
MRLYRAGDQSAGICENCQARVNTRMEYRDYTPSGWSVTVPDVLVAVCERCGEVVGIPHQSTPRINEYREDKTTDREAIEGRVPRAIEDAVELVTASLGGEPKSVRTAIFRYYLNLVATNPEVAEAVKIGSLKPLAQGKADRRLSIKMHRHRWEPAWSAAKAAGIANKGQLLRGVAVLAADDFRITTDHDKGGNRSKASRASQDRHAMLRALAKNMP